jgi:predicted nucleic acid-binding protein
MAGSRYLVDSNVLLRWVKPDDRDYLLVVAAIDTILARGSELCYTSQNVGEFWNTCTSPLDRNGFGLTPSEADRRARLFETIFQLLPDSLRSHQEWRGILIDHNIRGVQVHDARLAATMRLHGVRKLLNLKRFHSLFRYRVCTPKRGGDDERLTRVRSNHNQENLQVTQFAGGTYCAGAAAPSPKKYCSNCLAITS